MVFCRLFCFISLFGVIDRTPDGDIFSADIWLSTRKIFIWSIFLWTTLRLKKPVYVSLKEPSSKLFLNLWIAWIEFRSAWILFNQSSSFDMGCKEKKWYWVCQYSCKLLKETSYFKTKLHNVVLYECRFWFPDLVLFLRIVWNQCLAQESESFHYLGDGSTG